MGLDLAQPPGEVRSRVVVSVVPLQVVAHAISMNDRTFRPDGLSRYAELDKKSTSNSATRYGD